MKHAHLNSMMKGWFVGAFEPSVLHTNACEIAVKYYEAGDAEAKHFHKVATEITVIVFGTVKMFGATWNAGDIIIAEPGDATDFLAITNAINVVAKFPSCSGDKYLSDILRC